MTNKHEVPAVSPSLVCMPGDVNWRPHHAAELKSINHPIQNASNEIKRLREKMMLALFHILKIWQKEINSHTFLWFVKVFWDQMSCFMLSNTTICKPGWKNENCPTVIRTMNLLITVQRWFPGLKFDNTLWTIGIRGVLWTIGKIIQTSLAEC